MTLPLNLPSPLCSSKSHNKYDNFCTRYHLKKIKFSRESNSIHKKNKNKNIMESFFIKRI